MLSHFTGIRLPKNMSQADRDVISGGSRHDIPEHVGDVRRPGGESPAGLGVGLRFAAQPLAAGCI
jgi:hypothetical protein